LDVKKEETRTADSAEILAAATWPSRKPHWDKGRAFSSMEAKESAQIEYQCEWFCSAAPRQVILGILGKEAEVQVPDPKDRSAILMSLFKGSAGKAGASIAKCRRALELIKKYAMKNRLENGGFPVSAALAAHLIRTEHLRATTRGSAKKLKRGGSTAGHGVRAAFKILEALGAPIAAKDQPLVETASPKPQKGLENKAGPFPIKVRCHLEHLAKNAKHAPTRDFCRGFVVLGMNLCLRLAEILRAQVDTDSTSSKIVVQTRMKDGSHATLYSPADGFLGEYDWWGAFFTQSVMQTNHIFPTYKWGRGKAGLITHAQEAIDSAWVSEPHFRKSLIAVLALPPLKMSEAEVEDLDITGHSAHGTSSDMMTYAGPEQGFTVEDCDIVSHWRARAIEAELKEAARKSRSTKGTSQVGYSSGKSKTGIQQRQMEVLQKFHTFVRARLAGRDWRKLPPGRQDYQILAKEGSELEEDDDMYSSDSDPDPV
jgi:hypothetical protein